MAHRQSFTIEMERGDGTTDRWTHKFPDKDGVIHIRDIDGMRDPAAPVCDPEWAEAMIERWA